MCLVHCKCLPLTQSGHWPLLEEDFRRYDAALSLGGAMRRREFITLIGGAGAMWPLAAFAQQPERMRRIGALIALAETDAEGKAWVAGFRKGLEQRGWSEDQNLHIDYRFAPAGVQAQVLAKELVALQPDV